VKFENSPDEILRMNIIAPDSEGVTVKQENYVYRNKKYCFEYYSLTLTHCFLETHYCASIFKDIMRNSSFVLQ